MKKLIFQLVLLVAVFVGTTSTALAQDWSKLNYEGREILVDTTLLEAVVVTIAPGKKIGPVTHPAYFFYAFTDGKVKVHYPEGEPMVLEVTEGMSGFSAPEGPHIGENIGDQPIKFLLVELKEHPYVAASTKQ